MPASSTWLAEAIGSPQEVKNHGVPPSSWRGRHDTVSDACRLPSQHQGVFEMTSKVRPPDPGGRTGVRLSRRAQTNPGGAYSRS